MIEDNSDYILYINSDRMRVSKQTGNMDYIEKYFETSEDIIKKYNHKQDYNDYEKNNPCTKDFDILNMMCGSEYKTFPPCASEYEKYADAKAFVKQYYKALIAYSKIENPHQADLHGLEQQSPAADSFSHDNILDTLIFCIMDALAFILLVFPMILLGISHMWSLISTRQLSEKASLLYKKTSQLPYYIDQLLVYVDSYMAYIKELTTYSTSDPMYNPPPPTAAVDLQHHPVSAPTAIPTQHPQEDINTPQGAILKR